MSKIKRWAEETMGDDWAEQLEESSRRFCEEDL